MSWNEHFIINVTYFLQVFFKPGIENIRNNLGAESITDHHISNMCRQILDEAKHMFPPSPPGGGGGSQIVGAVEPLNEVEQKFIPRSVQLPSQAANSSQPQLNAPDTKLPLTVSNY